MPLPPLSATDDITLEPTPKRIRATLDGHKVLDSKRAQIVRPGHPPPRTYAVPREDIDGVPDGSLVDVGDGFVAVQWDDMDHWYEESEEVFVHPRDPHKRIDVLPTKRHVIVSLDGVKLAETRRATMLIESYPFLPIRYYMPPDDVEARLRDSDETSACPYKGFASYFDVQAGDGWKEGLAWQYKAPFREVDPIRGQICFYNEKVDMEIDGMVVPRPKTPFG